MKGWVLRQMTRYCVICNDEYARHWAVNGNGYCCIHWMVCGGPHTHTKETP